MKRYALLFAVLFAACSNDPTAPVTSLAETRADLVCNDCTPWVPDVPPLPDVKCNKQGKCKVVKK